MDHELMKIRQVLAYDGVGDSDDTPTVEGVELTEAVGYSGSMDIGRSKLHPWLKDQVDGYIRKWSKEKWKLVVMYLEDGLLQFRIERI
jgi:hypothetical protein